ncbi:MAG TPA: zincin-like metallopeptidase domain-containing protein [Rhizomicrobium sp.]|jgi:antirestriction protein ArdC
MSESSKEQRPASKTGLYQEITDKIISQIEAGTIPWVQPWAADQALSIPRNATTNRAYSGVNILLLWDALFERGFVVNRWLTFKQALSFGGNVRKGERGTTVVYADTFTPKTDGGSAPEGEDSGRRVPFLKRFTVFNVAQCDGLPFDYTVQPKQISQCLPMPAAEALIAASGAQFQRDDTKAYYHTGSDSIHVPPQESFFEPINFYRTALHELTHWTGAKHRLNRDFSGRFGSTAYAREELVAEMGSAFLCASLGIVPTVRHADYIGNWLEVLKNDSRAIVSAASHASKACDFLLAFTDSTDAEKAA